MARSKRSRPHRLFKRLPFSHPDESLAIHTHEAGTGRLHVEANVVRDFRLNECFEDWDRSIADSITESSAGRTFSDPALHELRCLLVGAVTQITVAGQPAGKDFHSIIVKDLAQIVIFAAGQGLSGQAAASSGLAQAPTAGVPSTSLPGTQNELLPTAAHDHEESQQTTPVKPHRHDDHDHSVSATEAGSLAAHDTDVDDGLGSPVVAPTMPVGDGPAK